MTNTSIDMNDTDDTLLLDRRGETRTVEFLGTDFAPIDSETLLNRIVVHANNKEPFGYFVNPNVDVIVKAHNNPLWQDLLKGAWLSVSDSRVLELFAQISSLKIPACPGSSLVEAMFDNVLKADEPINIIGGDAELVDVVAKKYGLSNVNFYEPPMGLKDKPDEILKAAKFIIEHPARFHFLCVGNPQQLMVAKKVVDYAKENNLQVTGVGLCVGASLDFIGGKTKRAPEVFQKLRLEWLFRLLSEPKRLWKRYLVEGPRIFKIWFDWKRQQKSNR